MVHYIVHYMVHCPLAQVIEKTKGLSFRSYVLAQNIEKRNLQTQTSA